MTETFSLGMPVRVGSRASELAIRQATAVAEALVAAGLREGYELVEIGSHAGGDPSQFAGGRLMTYALRQAVLAGRCDLSVHMLKDLPSAPLEGLTIGAYLKRVDPREALCARQGWTLATLPPGATVGISSPLRRQQLLEARPDLNLVSVRGSVESRLQRIDDGDLDATILAYPVLARLGLAGHVTELIEPTVIAPTPGQGALVIEVADSGVSPSLARALSRVDHLPSRIRAMAERALQERLEAGTRAPFGCLAAIVDPHDGTDSRSRLVLTAVVCGPDETKDVRRSRSTMLETSTPPTTLPATSPQRSGWGTRSPTTCWPPEQPGCLARPWSARITRAVRASSCRGCRARRVTPSPRRSAPRAAIPSPSH